MNLKKKAKRLCGCGSCHGISWGIAIVGAAALALMGGVLLCKRKKSCKVKKKAKGSDCDCGCSDSITEVVIHEIYPDDPDVSADTSS